MREDYTFAEFCADRDILPIDAHYKHYLPMWDIYEDEYLEFCEEEGFSPENLNAVYA
jgi:hypothetical protein